MPIKQKNSPQHTQRAYSTARSVGHSSRSRSFYITLAILATIAILMIAAFQLLAFVRYQDTTENSSDAVLGFLQQNTTNEKTVNTSAGSYVQTDTIQAIFLTNGQVYFGRMTTLTSDLVILEDVFYPKAQSNEQSTDEDASADTITEAGGVALRKLGKNEFHEPKDVLYIEPNNVLYWENLEEESRVTKGILEYEAKQKSASTVKTTPAANDASAKNEASETTANTNSSVTSEEDPDDLED
jgi:hypothetical protein